MKSKPLNIVFLFTIVILLALPSCSKFQDLAAFDVRYTIPRTTLTYVPSTFKSGEQLLYAGPVTANIDSIMNANGVSSGIVGTTTFTSLSVTIAEPSDLTFSWLLSARGEISQNADFATAQEIGFVENSNPTAKTVILTLNNVNIRPFGRTPVLCPLIWGVE